MTTAIPASGTTTPATSAYGLYVFDTGYRLVLAGSDPSDVSPVEATGAALPVGIRAALADVIAVHDFVTRPIAWARVNPRMEMRCMRTSGPAGTFFMVVTMEDGATV